MKKLFTLTAIIFLALTLNSYAFLNVGDKNTQNNNVCVKPVQTNKQTNIMGQDQKQNQNQGQLQGQGQKQVDNSVLIIEDEREFVTPADIKFGNSPTGFDEERSTARRGRKFTSIANQFMFERFRSVETAKLMLENYSTWSLTCKTTVKIMPKVKLGTYSATDNMVVIASKKEFDALVIKNNFTKVIPIGIAYANTKSKHGNSDILTNQTIIKGCAYGANFLIAFNLDTERNFKHRGLGGGAGGSDASNAPDTVLSTIVSSHIGSQRYEEEPFQIGHLVRVIQ